MAADPTQPVAVTDWISAPYRELPHDDSGLLRIRDELDESGVVELPDFFTPEAHDLLRRQILERESAASSSTESGNQKFALKGAHLTDTVVGQLARSPFMLDLANGILGGAGGRRPLADPPIRSEEIVPGINIMRGPGDVTAYHFDGTFLNVILPVVVPKISGARRGQLVIYPNVRSFRRSFWDTKVAPAIARLPLLRRFWKKREIDYREGSAYVFYGYRSLHGVESPAEAGLRCVTNMTVGAPRF